MLFEHFNYFKPTLFELFLITLFFQPVITRKVRKTKINVTFYLFVRIIFNYLIFFQKKNARQNFYHSLLDNNSILVFPFDGEENLLWKKRRRENKTR